MNVNLRRLERYPREGLVGRISKAGVFASIRKINVGSDEGCLIAKEMNLAGH